LVKHILRALERCRKIIAHPPSFEKQHATGERLGEQFIDRPELGKKLVQVALTNHPLANEVVLTHIKRGKKTKGFVFISFHRAPNMERVESALSGTNYSIDHRKLRPMHAVMLKGKKVGIISEGDCMFVNRHAKQLIMALFKPQNFEKIEKLNEHG